ncbi:hypothetical protein EUA93_00755 [Nocardioides oleivorans]|uniref:Uncharacterized protein n=1 Tax=Nocardioides oleivorans TaxID=273676 RepID=A0A4Q2RYI6_9ACTN|nr:hypothetical protein [Nocardioides oleivorans]RYB93009.1 hypothetical protein EUA93_00755 [Nocardioides oleivorans]
MSRSERRLERLGSGVRRRVQGKVATATGLDELAGLEESVDSLEVAVRENSALQVPLARLVDALERDVAGVLDRQGMGA